MYTMQVEVIRSCLITMVTFILQYCIVVINLIIVTAYHLSFFMGHYSSKELAILDLSNFPLVKRCFTQFEFFLTPFFNLFH